MADAAVTSVGIGVWLPKLLGRMAWNGMLLGGGLVSLALGLLYAFQDRLLYHPSVPGVPKSTKANPRGARSPAEHELP
jgi:hypothetical protein